MHDKKIGALPVLKDDKLVGIITTTDLMEVLLVAVGLTTDSKRFSLLATDRIGLIADIGKLMQQAEINIRSILVAPLEDHKDVWQIMLRVGVSVFPIAVQVLEDANYKVLKEYVEDSHSLSAVSHQSKHVRKRRHSGEGSRLGAPPFTPSVSGTAE